MPKTSIHDILPPDRRPPRRPEVAAENSQSGIERSFETPQTMRGKIRKGASRRSPYLLYSMIGLALVIVIGLLFSFIFGGARVTITPKEATLTVNGDFTAVLGDEPNSQELHYTIASIEATESSVVKATTKENVSLKSSGKIIIYNNFDKQPQRLIRNTRFETENGLVFRIDQSIDVPGQKMVSGELVPGSIEVTVFADEAGDRYNIGLSDFTIPGFAGSPRFEKFYARSLTPMTGGFVGEKLVVEKALLDQTRATLQSKLMEKLLAEQSASTGNRIVGFEEAAFFEFESLPTVEGDGSVEVVEKGTLHQVLFNELQLAEHIAKNTLGNFDGGSVRFLDKENLQMNIPEKEKIKPWRSDSFDFSLSGTAKIVWLFDEARLKQDLSGRNKAAMDTILSGYPGILRAEAVVKPFWQTTFPIDVAEIEIKVLLGPK